MIITYHNNNTFKLHVMRPFRRMWKLILIRAVIVSVGHMKGQFFLCTNVERHRTTEMVYFSNYMYY